MDLSFQYKPTSAKVFLILLFSLLTKNMLGQQHQISGLILDESGRPLAGATIKMPGARIGTATNDKGQFTISGTGASVTLVASFTGFQTREIKVLLPQKGDLQISLKVMEGLLNEVTVNTGYQQISRERATGSYVQIGNEQLNRRVSTDLISRIENLVPGLSFNKNPGAQNNPISIRGQSSINSSSQPLIVIDNFPYEGNLNTINPNDVESVSVLKDAAAASIWGAKAGNGVIVITTKKGKYNQRSRISLNTSLNIGNRPDWFYQPRMSMPEYIATEMRLFDEGFYRGAETSVTKAALSPVIELLIAKRDGGDAALIDAQLEALKEKDVRRDIRQYLSRPSLNQQYAVNVSGGGSNQSYFISGAYDLNKASDAGNNYRRLTLNANNTYKLSGDKLSLTSSLYYSESNQSDNNPNFTPLYPYVMLADDSGNPLAINKYRPTLLLQAAQDQLLDWNYRPLEELSLADNNSRLIDYRLHAGLKYHVIPEMKVQLLYQYGRGLSEGRDYQSELTYTTRDQINKLTIVNADGSLSRPVPLGGILNRKSGERSSHNLRAQLDYNRIIGTKHEIYALAGAEAIDNTNNNNAYRLYGYSDAYATSQIVDYVSTFRSYVNPSSTSNKISNIDSQKELVDRYLSYYANAAYTYQAKYTFSASARLDQSNLFGVKTNQRGVPLYSAGLSWLLSSESFFRQSWLPYLKLRATFGYNGNVSKSVTALTTARILPRVNAANNQPYAQIENPPNPELRWERVKILNFGMDFKITNDRIIGSVEYFHKEGIDLIGSTPFAPASGITTFKGNYASIKGQGLELNLNTTNISGRFRWNTNLLLSYVQDKVSHYLIKASSGNLIQGGDGSGTVIYPVEGKPLFSLYGYQWAGLEHATGDPQGYLDGTVSKNYAKIIAAGTESLEYLGPARPPFFGMIMNSFSHRGFSLSVSVTYKFGYYFRGKSISYSNDHGLASGHGDYTNRWKNPGDESFTNVPSIPAAVNSQRDNFYRNSSVNIHKGDHIRLQDVSLGYDLLSEPAKKRFISTAKIYLYLNNVGLLWKADHSVVDPDQALSVYPTVRTLALGFKLEF